MSITDKTIKVRECHCNRCQHKWHMKGKKVPKFCPACKSPYWNKPRVYGGKK